MKRPLKRLFWNKYVIMALVVFAMYYILEVYLYKLAKYNFNKLECVDENVCLKILLVADPQLIGLHNEIIHPLTGLAIFDIDRYLFKTYKVAYDFIKPHVVIFLGDLFDEGSTATQPEFNTYYTRFRKIYGDPSENVQHVYLPGDNDIGGEGYDIVTNKKVSRFENAFNQSNTFEIKGIVFYKYNRLTNSLVQPLESEVSKESINVGLSHVPFLKHDNNYVFEMIESTKPHVIFSAHDHSASIIEMKPGVNFREKINITPQENKVYKYFLSGSKTYEFIVPTVSYRMGTDKIGHGYAIIEGDRLSFTVLWSPVRFPQLILYGTLLIICILYNIFALCKICVKKRPRKYTSPV